MRGLNFRMATEADVPSVVALLRDDPLGAARECANTIAYLCAFRAMQDECSNHLIVGEIGARIVATYQITFVSGLSLNASRRAQIESVRVSVDIRSQGVGSALIRDAEARAVAAGCQLLQLTANIARGRAGEFYAREGFGATHVGFKKAL